MGTLGYMSPEQVRGLPVDHRSDIFSFGAILYELLTGNKAFRRLTASDTIAAILKEEPPDLSESGRNISPALDHIVRHCLEKDRDDRFQTAKDIAFNLTEQSSQSGVSGSREIAEPRASNRQALILVAAGVLVVAGVLLLRRSMAPSAVAGPSIAVLPFRNLSEDQSQDYFSDGLAEELAGLLAKVKELHVAGHASSLALKGKTEDLASIGQKLHVATVLEGSVRRSGDRLRVSTQLVSVTDGYQIWAETYDRKLTEVFAVQDEIAAAVVGALKVKLLPSDPPVASRHRTSNPEAYNEFLLGQQFFHRQNQDGFRRAVSAGEKAVALDPDYAAAYAWLARSLTMLVSFPRTAEEQEEIRRKALWAAERAVALDPGLAEGFSARGNARTFVGRDWSGAQADFERAFSLNPSDALTHAQYGRLLARLGRLPEAIAECKKATELDPLYTGAWNLLGSYLSSNGQLSEAQRALTRALEISPENEFGRFFLGVTLLLEGKANEALSGVGPPTNSYRLTVLALAEHSLGHKKESQQALDALIAKHGETAAYDVVRVYGWRGERDRAFEWLDRSLAQDDPHLPNLKTDPLVAKLRDDPRYTAMLKKLNLPVGK